MLEDAALLEQIRLGSPAAEAELCRTWAPRLRNFARCHFADEDLVQVALLGILQAAREGRIRELPSFALGTCRNVARRLREKRFENELPELVVEPPEFVDRGALMRCLEKLEERARQVVYLSFSEERSAQEIASSMSLSPANVRVIRHRSVLALRACLEGGAA